MLLAGHITLALMILPSSVVRTTPWLPGFTGRIAAMWQLKRIAPEGTFLAIVSIRSLLFNHRSSPLSQMMQTRLLCFSALIFQRITRALVVWDWFVAVGTWQAPQRSCFLAFAATRRETWNDRRELSIPFYRIVTFHCESFHHTNSKLLKLSGYISKGSYQNQRQREKTLHVMLVLGGN